MSTATHQRIHKCNMLHRAEQGENIIKISIWDRSNKIWDRSLTKSRSQRFGWGEAISVSCTLLSGAEWFAEMHQRDFKIGNWWKTVVESFNTNICLSESIFTVQHFQIYPTEKIKLSLCRVVGDVINSRSVKTHYGWHYRMLSGEALRNTTWPW